LVALAIFFIANFHVLGFFIVYLKNKLRAMFFRLTRGVAVLALDEIYIEDISVVLRATDIRYLQPLSFAPRTLNFEILKSLEQIQK
jgi:hypothetical protein